MTSTALLIGGGRFVGRRILDRLWRHGYRIDVLNRGVTRPAADLPPGVQHRPADRSDPSAVRQAIGGREYDLVVDASGYRPAEVRATLGAIDAGRYVYISTCVVYAALVPGPSEVGPLDEHDETVPPYDEPTGDLGAYYPGYKRACELVLLSQDRIPATVLRPCGIYGIGDHWYRHDYFFDRVIRERPILIPDSHYDRRVHLTDVEGLATVCLLAGEQSTRAHQVFNVADRQAVTCAELGELCARVAGHEPAIRVYPAEAATKLFPFGPEPGFSLSIARVGAELGWTGSVLAEGTAKLYQDFVRRYRAGQCAEPDFTVDDAVLEVAK